MTEEEKAAAAEKRKERRRERRRSRRKEKKTTAPAEQAVSVEKKMEISSGELPSRKFLISNKDRRVEFLAAAKENKVFESQSLSDGLVRFDTDYGFWLERQTKKYQGWGSQGLQQLRNVIELSKRATLELREFYYSLRTNQELNQPFEHLENIYHAVLSKINEAEVVTDCFRDGFTVGNFPKGFIYYAHSDAFGNPEMKIGFTENIARSVLKEEEISTAQSIIHVEKGAAATRLVSLGFSELTNSVIETTTGNVTRGTEILLGRFSNSKKLISFCDADVYGIDMHRSLRFGTMSRPYLDNRFPFLEIAGLYPSVAHILGLSNDSETKLPLNRPNFLKRMSFLRRYGLLDKRDEGVWMSNFTYELESLSPKFVSTKIKDKKTGTYQPVGLAAYLLEFMRLRNIPLKPQLSSNDVEVKREFDEKMVMKLRDSLKASMKFGIENPMHLVLDVIDHFKDEVVNEIMKREQIVSQTKSHLQSIDADDVRKWVAEYFVKHPKQADYKLEGIAKRTINTAEVVLENIDSLMENLNRKIETFVNQELVPVVTKKLNEMLEDAKNKIKERVVLAKPKVPESLPSQYDIAEKELGIREKDASLIRKALEERIIGGENR